MGYYDNYLEHHGILGQKWGVRRFENKGGHLTAAGKKRYTTDANGDYQKVKKSLRTNRLEKAANAAQRDADDLRKHGYTEEADAVQKVADKNRAKAEVSANKKGLTDKQKKILIAGAAVVGTSLAAYGGYKLYQLNKKATEGLSNEYHNAAVKKFTDSHAHDFLSGTNYSEGKLDRARTHFNAAADAKEAGRILQEKAKSKDYSIKDKVDYLKNKNSSIARDNRIEKALTYNKDGSFTNYALNKQGIKTVQPNRIELNRVELNTSNNSNERLQKTLNSMKAMSSNTVDVSKTGDDLVQELLRKNTLRF